MAIEKFKFGRYKGRAVDNIPSDYMIWALTTIADLKPALRTDIERVLRQRKAMPPALTEERSNREHLRAIRQEAGQ